MLKAIIIDDELDAINYLRSIIKEFCPGIEIIGTANTIYNGFIEIKLKEPDLVFLDIELTDGTGFDLLKKFDDRNFRVIFCTAHNDQALRAFKFSAVDYLLKPVDIIELKDAVDKVADAIPTSYKQFDQVLFDNYYHPTPTKLAVTINNGFDYISLEDIIRLEADRSYCNIHLKNGKKILVSKCLNEYNKLLKGKNFYRIHNSHLVNLIHVVTFMRTDGGFVKLSDGSVVPLSRNKKEEFLHIMKEFAIA
jgi:two-component system, LytTR family, response regulator